MNLFDPAATASRFLTRRFGIVSVGGGPISWGTREAWAGRGLPRAAWAFCEWGFAATVADMQRMGGGGTAWMGGRGLRM